MIIFINLEVHGKRAFGSVISSYYTKTSESETETEFMLMIFMMKKIEFYMR
jgi:hypothetical protein